MYKRCVGVGSGLSKDQRTYRNYLLSNMCLYKLATGKKYLAAVVGVVVERTAVVAEIKEFMMNITYNE